MSARFENKVATRASPRKLEAREPWKQETFAQRRHLMGACACASYRQTWICDPFFVSFVGPDGQQIRVKVCFIKWWNYKNQRLQMLCCETTVMIPACPDCQRVVMMTVSFSGNLRLRPSWNSVCSIQYYLRRKMLACAGSPLSLHLYTWIMFLETFALVYTES